MNALDYYNNPDIRRAMALETRHIKNKCDIEDCEQEIFAELYDFMPLDPADAIRIVCRVAKKFKRNNLKIAKNEIARDSQEINEGNGNYMMRSLTSPWDTGEYGGNPRISIP
jgi:hypothetical protein